jgi:hypothetical protein
MFEMCSDFSMPIGSTVLSRTHSILREYQPHNNNFALFLAFEYRTVNHTKIDRAAAGCHLESVWMCTYSVAPLTAQCVFWKDANSDVSKAESLSVFRHLMSHVRSVPVNTKPDLYPTALWTESKSSCKTSHIGTDRQTKQCSCSHRT